MVFLGFIIMIKNFSKLPDHVNCWVYNINKYLHTVTLLQLDHFKNDFDILTYKLFAASDNQKQIRVFSNFNDFLTYWNKFFLSKQS
jgi:hypothetical protein